MTKLVEQHNCKLWQSQTPLVNLKQTSASSLQPAEFFARLLLHYPVGHPAPANPRPMVSLRYVVTLVYNARLRALFTPLRSFSNRSFMLRLEVQWMVLSGEHSPR